MADINRYNKEIKFYTFALSALCVFQFFLLLSSMNYYGVMLAGSSPWSSGALFYNYAFSLFSTLACAILILLKKDFGVKMFIAYTVAELSILTFAFPDVENSKLLVCIHVVGLLIFAKIFAKRKLISYAEKDKKEER